MTLRDIHVRTGSRPTPARRSWLPWTLAAAGGALFAFVLFAVDALGDLSDAVHLMA